MPNQVKRNAPLPRGSQNSGRPIFVHRFIYVPGASPLPRDLVFPCMITLDGKLPAHLARFRYAVERLN